MTLGVLPISKIIQQRRLLYLHHILNQEEDSLLNKILRAQIKKPVRNDWIKLAYKDLEHLEITLTLEEIKSMSKGKFSKIVQQKVDSKAFEELIKEKNNQSKVKNCIFSKLQMEYYFEPSHRLSKQEMIFMFLAKTRNLPLKNNFKFREEDISCPTEGCIGLDSQEHLFSGECLPGVTENHKTVYYTDIFSTYPEKALEALKLLKHNYDQRQEILSQQRDPEDQDTHSDVLDLGARRGALNCRPSP